MKKRRRKAPKHLKIHEREIVRRRWENGETYASLAREYNVSAKTLYEMHRREGWKRPAPRQPEEVPVVTSRQKDFVETNTGELLRPQAPTAAPPALVQATGRQLMVAEGVWHIVTRFLDSLQRMDMDKAPEAAARAIHSLTQSLERLQKVERTALDADTHKDTKVSVVIVVPAKQELDEWQSMAIDAVVEDAE